jgi:anti-anti-sigma regulatory factor
MIRSETLDISLENKKGAMRWTLAGHFHNEQAPSIREKFVGLMDDGCRAFVIDMEGVTGVDDAVVPMFLGLLNTLRGKGGEMKFVFKNDALRAAFRPYANLFQIYPDAESLSRDTVLGLLKKRSRVLTRKTGFRISRSVAIFLSIVLCGWFLTLLAIIHTQNERIRQQQHELQELGLWKLTADIEIEAMRERLQPLEQLGIVPSAPEKK